MIRAARALLGLIALAAATGACAQATPGRTIVIASDSTAADYATDRYPQMGWGMMLACGLSPDARVSNHAMGGRSTRTFMGEGRLQAILEAIAPGDTVLIQFAHNDANKARPERYVSPAGYRANLERFIRDIRARKGVPVLLTPVARRSFEGGAVKADFAEYSAVVRAVARQSDTPLIDLEGLSRAWIGRAGAEASKRYFLHYVPGEAPVFPEGIADDTHFSELGARGIADLVAGALKRLGLPVSALVRDDRPDLRRTTPLGRVTCR